MPASRREAAGAKTDGASATAASERTSPVCSAPARTRQRASPILSQSPSCMCAEGRLPLPLLPPMREHQSSWAAATLASEPGARNTGNRCQSPPSPAAARRRQGSSRPARASATCSDAAKGVRTRCWRETVMPPPNSARPTIMGPPSPRTRTTPVPTTASSTQLRMAREKCKEKMHGKKKKKKKKKKKTRTFAGNDKRGRARSKARAQ